MSLEELTREIADYPEDLRNGSFLANQYLAASQSEEDSAVLREYFKHVMKLAMLGKDAEAAGHPEAEKVLNCVREPMRIITVYCLALATRETTKFKNQSDPLFWAALAKANKHAGEVHQEDILHWGGLLWIDFKSGIPRYAEAMVKLTRCKTSDNPTYCRLMSAFSLRLLNGKWPTLSEVEIHANENFKGFDSDPGDKTWFNFRKRHRLEWWAKSRGGMRSNPLKSAGSAKRSGIKTAKKT